MVQSIGTIRLTNKMFSTPIVEVLGVNFLPIEKETVEFDTVVTPEFSSVAIAVIMASILGVVT